MSFSRGKIVVVDGAGGLSTALNLVGEDNVTLISTTKGLSLPPTLRFHSVSVAPLVWRPRLGRSFVFNPANGGVY
jgi:hypothetical protein